MYIFPPLCLDSFRSFDFFRPVHRCKFTTDNVHVVSFSDDKSVALWDLPSETEIIKFSEHSVIEKFLFKIFRYQHF